MMGPQLSQVLKRAVDQGLGDVWVSMPARVERVNTDEQTVDAQPLIQRMYRDEDGDLVPERLPVVTRVPINYNGSGSYRATFPVAVGDLVLLVFVSGSLDRWLERGGEEVDPADPRRNDLTDAIAIPGLHAPTRVPTSVPDAYTVHSPTEILLGENATKEVALNEALEALADVFDNWTPVAGDGGAALKGLLTTLLATGWPTGATKVKAE